MGNEEEKRKFKIVNITKKDDISDDTKNLIVFSLFCLNFSGFTVSMVKTFDPEEEANLIYLTLAIVNYISLDIYFEKLINIIKEKYLKFKEDLDNNEEYQESKRQLQESVNELKNFLHESWDDYKNKKSSIKKT